MKRIEEVADERRLLLVNNFLVSAPYDFTEDDLEVFLKNVFKGTKFELASSVGVEISFPKD